MTEWQQATIFFVILVAGFALSIWLSDDFVSDVIDEFWED